MSHHSPPSAEIKGCRFWSALGLRDCDYDNSLPLPPIIIPFQRKHGVPSLKCTGFTRAAYNRNTPLKAHAPTYPSFSKPFKNRYDSHQSPSGPVYTKIHLSFRDLRDRLTWTWKYTSKLPAEKGYAYHPERPLDEMLSNIHGFPP